MISFRYHLVTIVAVFLALGLGLLAGTTAVEPRLVRQLRVQTDLLRRDVSDLRGEVGDLQTRVGQLQHAGDILPALDSGRLSGVPVVVVTQDGVDSTLLSETRHALEVAHAQVTAVLSVTSRMAATDDAARQGLAEILRDDPSTTTKDLLQQAVVELGQRLANGVSRSADGTPTVDVLGELLSSDFIGVPGGSPQISPGTLPQIGGRGQVLVVLVGGDTEPKLSPADFMIPLVNELVRRSATVAAGESVSTVYPFVSALRANGAAFGSDPMVTVDDLDLNVGGAALVLGLERLLVTGRGGNYGIKAGADGGPIPSG